MNILMFNFVNTEMHSLFIALFYISVDTTSYYTRLCPKAVPESISRELFKFSLLRYVRLISKYFKIKVMNV